MGRYAKENGEAFEDAPIGTHVATCIKLIDLGTQHDEYQGKSITHEKIFVQWELPHERMSDGKPFVVGAFLTNSLSEKATMRKWLESWRGRPFTSQELAGFDLMNILGKSCLLSVIAKGEGKTGVKVGGVMSLTKGTAVPPPENAPSAFWLDEFNRAEFDKMRDGIKEIIMKSEEYKAMTGGPTPQPPAGGKGGGTFDDMDDDIPF